MDPNETRPFIEVAERKRLLVSFNAEAPAEPHPFWRLDMDLVRISVENALARARQQKMDVLAERLERLLRMGTAVQQVDFVLGSRATYYFPEDIERMVIAGPQVAHRFSLQRFSWLRCRPLDDGSQNCEEHHNQICLIH